MADHETHEEVVFIEGRTQGGDRMHAGKRPAIWKFSKHSPYARDTLAELTSLKKRRKEKKGCRWGKGGTRTSLVVSLSQLRTEEGEGKEGRAEGPNISGRPGPGRIIFHFVPSHATRRLPDNELHSVSIIQSTVREFI